VEPGFCNGVTLPDKPLRREPWMKSALLWLVGIPIPLIIIANLAGWL
jgi:hypothetical protein